MKILLVQPPPPPDWIGFRRTAMPEPLALETIGAVVRPQHDVRLLDMRFDAGLEQALAEFEPDVAAVTCLTTEVYSAQDVLREVKRLRPETFTVSGGLHASLIPRGFPGRLRRRHRHRRGRGDVPGTGGGAGPGARAGPARPWGRSKAWRGAAGRPRAATTSGSSTSRGPCLPSLDALPIPARDLSSRWTAAVLLPLRVAAHADVDQPRVPVPVQLLLGLEILS